MNETKETGAAVTDKGVFVSIALDKVVVVENVRKHFDAEKMKSLTESARSKGIYLPIIVMNDEKAGTFRLID